MISVANEIGYVNHFEIKESTKNPGVRYIKFSLGVDKGFGQNKERDWFQCRVFGDLVERMEKAKVGDGSLIQVVGAARHKTYKRKSDGADVNYVEVTLYDFAYIPSGGKKADANGTSPAPAAAAPASPPAQQPSQGFEEVEVDDDGDLPF